MRFDYHGPEFDTGSSAVYELANSVLRYGQTINPRGQVTKELRDVTFRLETPYLPAATEIGRNMRPAIAGAETLQLIGGFTDAQAMVKVSKQFAKFMDDGELMGAYGPRIAFVMQDVIRTLVMDPASRQAVVTVIQDQDLFTPVYKDVPCTVSFTFYIRNDRLHMKTHMRSNDTWLGLPYDLVQFTQLQATVATMLDLEAGHYTHHVDSFHAYERDFEKIEGLHEPIDAGPRLNGLAVKQGGRNWVHTRDRATMLFYNESVDDLPRRRRYSAPDSEPKSTTEEWLTNDLARKLEL